MAFGIESDFHGWMEGNVRQGGRPIDLAHGKDY
jgi:hypothetical protein